MIFIVSLNVGGENGLCRDFGISQGLLLSAEDIDVTYCLAAAGEILGIELIDYLTVNDIGFFSLKEHWLF